MKLIILLLLFSRSISHDVQVAYYKIYQETSMLNIEFVFENEDITGVLESPMSDEDLQEYISSHFSISINDNPQNLIYNNFKIKGSHIYIVAAIPNVTEKISTINISNTCLLNIEDQSNIVNLRLHEQERDFLMNKDRTSIRITY